MFVLAKKYFEKQSLPHSQIPSKSYLQQRTITYGKNPPMLLQKQGSAIIKATLNNLFY